MIKRILEENIKNKLFKGKAILLFGARQTGKTTLINNILKENKSVIMLDGDNPTHRRLLNEPNIEEIMDIIRNYRIIFIDEAQRFKNIGLTSKMIVDNFKDKQLILSGSSAFELTQEINEPLTGRKWSYYLWPISWEEYENEHGYLNAEQNLKKRIIYGMYPDVINHEEDKKKVLMELSDSYLFKDILAYQRIKNHESVQNLLVSISYQIGSEVSYSELSRQTGLDNKTIEKYIRILEQAYIILRLPSFSRNLRNELKKSKKIYFYDNGIRNAVIGNLNNFDNRDDKAALWENFLISERVKYNTYRENYAKSYFWRTRQKQEIDYIEEINANIYAYEFKWSEKKKAKISKTFTKNYESECFIVNRKNFREFVK